MRSLLVLSLLLSVCCRADIYVVTHRDNPIESLSEQQVRDLYLARSKAWPNGEFIVVYDHEDTELRSRFFKRLTGMSLRQADAYWARLIFAGRILPLEQLSGEAALVDIAKETSNMLGYLENPPESQLLKVLYVIPSK